MDKPFAIRPAAPGDERAIADMVREMAAFVRYEGDVGDSAEALRGLLFEDGAAGCLLAEQGGRAAGYALYLFGYSTFRAKPTLYIEDIFVREAARGQGLGEALFGAVKAAAVKRGCAGMYWTCLNWNAGALALYRKMGAKPNEDMTLFRLDLD